MNQARKEGACRQNHCTGEKRDTQLCHNTGNAIPVDYEVVNHILASEDFSTANARLDTVRRFKATAADVPPGLAALAASTASPPVVEFEDAASRAGLKPLKVRKAVDLSQPLADDEIPAFLKKDRQDVAAAIAAAPPVEVERKAKGKAGKADKPAAEKPAEKTVAPGSKKAIMLDMVLRPEGATEEDICKAIGWKACLVTLRRTAVEAGVELTREKVKGSKTVWHAVKKAA